MYLIGNPDNKKFIKYKIDISDKNAIMLTLRWKSIHFLKESREGKNNKQNMWDIFDNQVIIVFPNRGTLPRNAIHFRKNLESKGKRSVNERNPLDGWGNGLSWLWRTPSTEHMATRQAAAGATSAINFYEWMENAALISCSCCYCCCYRYALPRTGQHEGREVLGMVFNLSKCVANVYLINEMNYCTSICVCLCRCTNKQKKNNNRQL